MTGNEAPAFAMADLAKNYRIGLAELERLRNALAPAFALGLQRALETPARWPELSRLFGAGLFPPGNADAGAGMLDLFFPVPGLRDAVSRQAAAMTGLGAPIVAEMMPRLAALGAEAMMRGAMANVLPRPAVGLPADDLGRLTAEMMRRGANAVEAFATPASPPRASASPFSPFFVFDAFGEAVRATLGSPAVPTAKPVPPTVDFDPQAPFAPMFEAFAKGMRSAAAATAMPALPASANGTAAGGGAAASPARPDPDLLEAFVQSGRRLQDSYVREMTALFARFSDKERGGEGQTPP